MEPDDLLNGQPRPGFINNTATADSDETDPDSASAEAPLAQNATILIDKAAVDSDSLIWNDANGNDRADAGETVDYNFDVTNTGNVDLYNVTVTDNNGVMVSALSGLTDLDADGAEDDLAAGAIATATGTYTLLQSDINAGTFVNTADADAVDPNDDPVNDDDTETVTLPQVAEIQIDKKTNGEDYGGNILAGQPVTWTYEVTNTGNVTLYNIALSDDQLGTISVAGLAGLTDEDGDSYLDDLVVGGSFTASMNGTATVGSYENTGTVNAVGPQDQPASDSDESSYFGISTGGVIMPTGTDCHDYIQADPETFQEYYAGQGGVIQYSVKGNVINALNPGVFFAFFGKDEVITDSDGDGTIKIFIDQSNDENNNPNYNFTNNPQVIQLLKIIDTGDVDGKIDPNDECVQINLNSANSAFYTTGVDKGDIKFDFTAAEDDAFYVLRVQYDTAGVKGNAKPAIDNGTADTKTLVSYAFDLSVDGDYIQTASNGVQMDLKPTGGKPNKLLLDVGDTDAVVHGHAPVLKDAALQHVVDKAIAYWSEQGANVDGFSDIDFEIRDLGLDDQGNSILGENIESVITIDDDGGLWLVCRQSQWQWPCQSESS